MANAVQDPPVNVREKGGRIVVVFNVANVRQNSLQVKHEPEEGAPGSLLVSFSSVSPSRNFEKRLALPHAVSGTPVSDIQSKCVTVQLVKADSEAVWGTTWFKESKGGKGKAKRPAAGPGTPVLQPNGAPQEPCEAHTEPLEEVAEAPQEEDGDQGPEVGPGSSKDEDSTEPKELVSFEMEESEQKEASAEPSEAGSSKKGKGGKKKGGSVEVAEDPGAQEPGGAQEVQKPKPSKGKKDAGAAQPESAQEAEVPKPGKGKKDAGAPLPECTQEAPKPGKGKKDMAQKPVEPPEEVEAPKPGKGKKKEAHPLVEEVLEPAPGASQNGKKKEERQEASQKGKKEESQGDQEASQKGKKKEEGQGDQEASQKGKKASDKEVQEEQGTKKEASPVHQQVPEPSPGKKGQKAEEVEESAAAAAAAAPTNSEEAEAKAGKKKRARRSASKRPGQEDVSASAEADKEAEAGEEELPRLLPQFPGPVRGRIAAARAAKERAAQQLEEESRKSLLQSFLALQKAGNGNGSKEERGFGVRPPMDPELILLIGKATQLMETDKRESVKLLKLAAKKGYLPAHLMIAQLASERDDDMLLIDSLCQLLADPKAEGVIPRDCLSQCAMQLSSVLRKPGNAAEARKREEEVEALAKSWPILNAVKMEHLKEMVKVLTAGGAASGKSNEKPASSTSRSLAPAVTSSASTGASAPAPRAAASGATANKPAVSNRQLERGEWTLVDGQHRFEVEVPEIASPLESCLDISNHEVRICRPNGSDLVRMKTPRGFDASNAEAKWLKKHHRFIITTGPIKTTAVLTSGPKDSSPAKATARSTRAGFTDLD